MLQQEVKSDVSLAQINGKSVSDNQRPSEPNVYIHWLLIYRLI